MFREPPIMRSPVQKSKRSPKLAAVFLVVIAAFITQGALVGLQLMSGEKIVDTKSSRGLGVKIDRNVRFNMKRRSCESQATGDGSAISVTSCRDTFFQRLNNPSLRGDKHLIQLFTTYGFQKETHPFMFTVTVLNEVFARTV